MGQRPRNTDRRKALSKLFLHLQNALPQHALSRLLGWFARNENPRIAQPLITAFAKAYDVSLDEAIRSEFRDYNSFNDFFTRQLQADARPMPEQADAVISPVDGHISQFGVIDGDQLMQAKGHRYSLQSLAGATGRGLEDGRFCTVYLAPSDYHRIHLPIDGELVETRAIPGALFSVNGVTEAGIPGLFCRNERLVCRFETQRGPMLLVFVGALVVASIETVWPGPTSPYRQELVSSHAERLTRGAELGRFLLGSTVIACFAKDAVEFSDTMAVGQQVRLGQPLGKLS